MSRLGEWSGARWLVRAARFRAGRPGILLPLAFTGGLLWLSSIPGTPRPDASGTAGPILWLPPEVQNLLHVPLYGMLGWLYGWSLTAWIGGRRARTIAAIVTAGFVGIVDELYQTTVPGRYGSLTDLLLNVVGVVLGLWLYEWARGAAG
jgi:hypothetical protein